MMSTHDVDALEARLIALNAELREALAELRRLKRPAVPLSSCRYGDVIFPDVIIEDERSLQEIFYDLVRAAGHTRFKWCNGKIYEVPEKASDNSDHDLTASPPSIDQDQ
jgi:hypothetical protein